MNKHFFLLSIMLYLTASVSAVEVEIDGLWYNVISKTKEAKVIRYKNDIKYRGDIIIPGSVEYESASYIVTSIESDAFSDCKDLHSVTISEGITSIGSYAFYGCQNLKNVTIPKSVTSIGINAFWCDNLEELYITDLEAWCVIEYTDSPSMPPHKMFLNGEEIKELIIPTNVTSISSYAFTYCSGLTSVVIPSSVTSIGNAAFDGCSNLTSVSIASGVSTLGRCAFRGCTELISVEIPSSVNTLEAGLFQDCSKLSSIIIPNSVTSIEGSVFINCSALTSISIPNSVTNIGFAAFYGCSNLTTIIIGNNVETIRGQAFANCTELTDVYCYTDNLPSTNTDVFEGSLIEYATLHVPSSLIDVYKSTAPWKEFKKIVSLGENQLFNLIYMVDGEIYKSYQIEEGATITPEAEPTKEGYTFSGWSEIPETMPDYDVTVTGSFIKNITVGDAFTLDNITYKVTNIEPREVQLISADKSIESIEIPSSVKGSDGLDYLVTSIGGRAFANCRDLTSITIPSSVTYIGNFSFLNCSGLTSIIIPNDVNSIGESAFNGCSGLTSMIIPNNVTSIGVTAFKGCSGLNSVTIPNSVISIGESAFVGCSGLTSITIPNSVMSIEKYTFYECSGLTSITIPNSVTSIGDYAFSYCSGLTSLTIPGSVSAIGSGAFYGCNLSNVITNIENPFVIDISTFSDYTYLNAILYVPTESYYMYKTTDGWKSFVHISDGLKYKLTYFVDNEEYSVYEIECGTKITPEPEPTKEGYTFSGWSEIPETMPANDVYVTGSFAINKYKLTYIIDGVEYKSYEIEYGATITPEEDPVWEGHSFSGWSEIPETMPAHDVTITGTFTQVVFNVGNVMYEISDDGTATVTGGEENGEVTIEPTIVINGQTFSVIAIAENAFKDNKAITSVTIPDGISTIGDNAFNGCVSLFLINLGKDVISISSKAFANIGTAPSIRTRSDENSLIVNCYAKSVPQAASDVFDNTPIDTAKLLVDDNLVDAYKSIYPWRSFGKIYGFNDPTGVNEINIDSQNARIYDMQGNRLDNVRKGVNIVRIKDGKTMKVIIK